MAQIPTPVAPRPLPRALLAVASAAMLAVFVVFALLVRRTAGPIAFDQPVIRVVLSGPIAEGLGIIPRSRSYAVFTELATLGSLLPAIFMVTAIAVVAYVHHDRPALMLCVLGPATAVAVSMWVAKPLVDRVREKALMFPSGHTTVATAIAVVTAVVVFRWYGRRWLLMLAPLLAVLPLAVSLGVVRMNWHYPTDALGGMLLGAGVVLAVAALLPARWPPEPAAGDSAQTNLEPATPPQR